MEQIVRDLMEISISLIREKKRKSVVSKAELSAEERILDALVGETASDDTRQKFRKMLREGELDEKEIEVDVMESQSSNMPSFDIPGMPGASMGMLNLGDILGGQFGGKTEKKKMPVSDALEALTSDEGEKLLDEDGIIREAIENTEQTGIVFIDEIDKNVENIGARRLHTVLERILDEISFEATDMPATEVTVDADYITKHIGDLADTSDLSKFIL